MDRPGDFEPTRRVGHLWDFERVEPHQGFPKNRKLERRVNFRELKGEVQARQLKIGVKMFGKTRVRRRFPEVGKQNIERENESAEPVFDQFCFVEKVVKGRFEGHRVAPPKLQHHFFWEKLLPVPKPPRGRIFERTVEHRRKITRVEGEIFFPNPEAFPLEKSRGRRGAEAFFVIFGKPLELFQLHK